MRRMAIALLGGTALLCPASAATGAAPARASAEARTATVDLTAHRIRIGDHPAFVRVVVDFTDGRLGVNDSEAANPDPFDGTASVDVRHRRIQAQAPARRAHGVRVRITQATDRVRVRLNAQPGRFKYLRRWQLSSPDRVVLDLYKSRPPVTGAEILTAPDGCLSLDRLVVSPPRIRASGRARFLFENTFQLVVRDRRGAEVGDRIVTVARPFGRWWSTVRYDVDRTQPGTLEAVALSARDGALACLAQARVRLRP